MVRGNDGIGESVVLISVGHLNSGQRITDSGEPRAIPTIPWIGAEIKRTLNKQTANAETHQQFPER